MVSVVIGDGTYEVAVPYKLRQLEAAAPFIDALNEGARDIDGSVKAMAATFRNMLAALLPGISKNHPAVTLDTLIDDFDPSQWVALRAAFDAVFNASGLGSGEAPAAAAEQATDAA
jgi:SpoVK/Ycf46/Vps4 family AAA+-type ATPase